MEIRPFHAFRTWKVHVVIFSFHATHFHTLLTTLQFRYVNARFRHPVYHATHLNQTLLATPHFRYVNARFDFRCVDYRLIMVLFAKSELWLSLCADWLRSIFYCYLLTFGKLTRWQ